MGICSHLLASYKPYMASFSAQSKQRQSSQEHFGFVMLHSGNRRVHWLGMGLMRENFRKQMMKIFLQATSKSETDQLPPLGSEKCWLGGRADWGSCLMAKPTSHGQLQGQLEAWRDDGRTLYTALI